MFTAGNKQPSWRRGFTLIELLVVISIIALLAGVVGMALKDGNPGASLRSAQSTLVSMVSVARGQAALNQSDARLLVYASSSTTDDMDKERYLRYVRVVVDKSGTWTPVGEAVMLPEGAYVVPPTAPTGTLVESGVTWSADGVVPVSGFSVSSPWTLPYDSKTYYYINFKSVGTIDGANVRIAVGSAKRDANGPKFDNPDDVRGFLIRSMGNVTLLNDTASFGP